MDTGYIEGIGTVRECIDCGVIVVGGPTRCTRCAKFGPPQRGWLYRSFHKTAWRYKWLRVLFKGAGRAR